MIHTAAKVSSSQLKKYIKFTIYLIVIFQFLTIFTAKPASLELWLDEETILTLFPTDEGKNDAGADGQVYDRMLFPDSTRIEPSEGEPPSAAVYRQDQLIGYVFATPDAVPSLGFSATQFTILVGMDSTGLLTGVTVVSHDEPLIKYNKLEEATKKFSKQYAGLDLGQAWRIGSGIGPSKGVLDGISGATVSAILFHDAILRSGRAVARARGLGSDVASVDMSAFRPVTWQELVDEMSIVDARIDLSDGAAVEISLAQLSPATVGIGVLGESWYSNFVSNRSPRDLVFLLMMRGPVSFISNETHITGLFERLGVSQNGKSFKLDKSIYRYMPFLKGSGKPSFDEMGLFWLDADSGIEATAPWTLEFSLPSVSGDGEPVSADVAYRLLDHYIVPASTSPDIGEMAPAWVMAWSAQAANLILLAALLTVLVAILVFQDRLARRPRAYRILRISFLAVVLVWLGWIAGGQVTVLSILTLIHGAVGQADLTVMLADPIIVVLLLFSLATFVYWGRGVFCGWLCPFGALQELVGKLAQALRVPQITLSEAAHRRLWPVKYVVLLGLIGLSFHAMSTANMAAEIEPFKTAITLQFSRDWPYVAYALALLAIGMTVERAFCRFLCPLGAAMAIGGRLRLFNPLKRRAECGSPCQLCTRACPIGAIETSGKIRMDECFYCLDCQLLYQDETRCPPLVKARKRSLRDTEAEPVAA